MGEERRRRGGNGTEWGNGGRERKKGDEAGDTPGSCLHP